MSLKIQTKISSDIEDFKNRYYLENGKNIIFKKSQKLDCAEKIEEEFNINTLVSHTLKIIPNTNKVYFDYPIFKLFANPNNYDLIFETTIILIEQCISKYGSFECHVNLNGFTVTATERYKTVILMFCNACLKHDTHYTRTLDKLCIYNTPIVIDTLIILFSKLIDPVILSKRKLFNKTESEVLLKDLLQ